MHKIRQGRAHTKGRKELKKKILTLVLTTVLIVSALAGCGNVTKSEEANETQNEQTTQDEQPESGTVSLTVWAEENNFEMLTQMIDGFKQKYAGQADFDISLVQQSDSTTKDTILGDVHAAADVFSFPDDQLISLVASGALEPVPNADVISSANLEESVAAASYNGVLYGYPMTADNGYFLYYDKSYFTEDDVKTMDRILEVAEAAGKEFSMELTSGWYLYSFFGGTGMDFGINDDGVTNHCNWNTTEGSIIAGISGVWNAVAVKEAWGSNYGAVKLPTYTCAGQQVQMSSFTGYKMMGVNYYSEHKEWACKLADWLTNEENQTIRFQQRSQGPSNINAAASDEIGKDPAIAAVIDQGQYGNLQRVGNSYWDACTDFANTILNGNPEGKDWQEIMDTLVDKITASVVG